jgi:hypothetical protein
VLAQLVRWQHRYSEGWLATAVIAVMAVSVQRLQ